MSGSRRAAASVPVPSRRPGHPRRLGPGPGRARATRSSQADDAGLRRALGALPAHDPLGQRPRRRPARRPDGQLRGRPPEPRRRRGRQAGPGPDRRRDRRRQLLRERGAARRLRGGPQQPARAPAPDGPRLRRRRALGLGAHRGAASSSPRRRACPTSSSTRSPTGATRCRTRRRGYIEELERWLRHAGRVGTVGGRYYAMDRDRRWERTKLAYDAIVHARGAARRDRRRGGRRGLRARARPTSSSARP